MTTASSQLKTSYLNAKTSITSKRTQQVTTTTAAAGYTATRSRSPSNVPFAGGRNVPSDRETADQRTISLIKRILGSQTGIDTKCPATSIENILPPLTSSNAVDLQLYALISEVVKEFIQPWYSNITPDHVFVEEVVQIIAHCTRATEERLRHIDVNSLLLNEIPALVEGHITTFRKVQNSDLFSDDPSLPATKYHALVTHPGLSPFPDADHPETREKQAQNEAVYRQLLVQGVLAAFLPIEDLQNPCLRTLVTDVIADLILGEAISTKVCQPEFIYETLIRVVGEIKARVEPRALGKEVRQKSRSRLEESGLLSSKEQSWASNSSPSDQSRSPKPTLFWQLLQYLYLFLLYARFIAIGLYRARSLPPPSPSSIRTSSPPIAKPVAPPSRPLQLASNLSLSPQPILEYRVFSLIATLFDLSARMPWLAGLLSLSRHAALHGYSAEQATNQTFDKFLRSAIASELFSWPSLLPTILLHMRDTLFPLASVGNVSGSAGSSRTSSVDAIEQADLRCRAGEAVLSLIPARIARTYYTVGADPYRRRYQPLNRNNSANNGSDDNGKSGAEDNKHKNDTATHEDVTTHRALLDQIDQDILAPFSDSYLNRHLIYSVLDLIIAKLVPEMADHDIDRTEYKKGLGAASEDSGSGKVNGYGKGVFDLLAERGVIWRTEHKS